MENINKNRLKVVYGDCTLGVSGEGFSYIFFLCYGWNGIVG